MTNESSSPNESPLTPLPRSRQPSTNCEEDAVAAAASGVVSASEDSPRSWHNASPSVTDTANTSASSVDSAAAKLLNKRNSTNDQQIDKCIKRDERSKSCSNVVVAGANSICTTTSDLNESITASSISPASSSSNSIAISSVDNHKQSSSNSLKRSLDISSDAGSSDYSGSAQAPPAKKMSYSIMNILGSGNGNNGKERENFSNKENAKNDNQSESNDYSSRSQSPSESAYQQRPSPPSALQTSPRSAASEASKNAAAMGLLMSNPLAAASGLHPSMAASLFQQHMNASSSSSATHPMANNFNSFLLSPILAAAAAAAQSGGNSSQQPHASLLNNISNLAFLSGLNNLNGGAQSLNKPPTANPSDLWPWFNMAAVSALYGLDSKLEWLIHFISGQLTNSEASLSILMVWDFY